MEEKIFLSVSGCKVTNTRLELSGTTYALANISSCKIKTIDESFWDDKSDEKNKAKIISVVIGILLMFINGGFGFIILIIGVIGTNFFIKGEMVKMYSYELVIGTNAGEVVGLKDRYSDKNLKNIANAINDAIIYRG